MDIFHLHHLSINMLLENMSFLNLFTMDSRYLRLGYIEKLYHSKIKPHSTGLHYSLQQLN